MDGVKKRAWALIAASGLLLLLLFTLARSTATPPAADSEHQGPRPADPSYSVPEIDGPSASAVPAKPAGKGSPKILAKGAPVVRGKWGGKPGEFGRRAADESNPESPMAILAGHGDELWVLDQVNLRVQRFVHGEPAGSFQASETVQDLARLPNGKTVLLDRLADKNVQIYGPDGKLANTIPIEGKGIANGGAVTGIFGDDRGVYVERDHTTLVQIADADGNQDGTRSEIPGRPTRDGKAVVTLALSNQTKGEFFLTSFDRTTYAALWSETLSFGMPVLHVLLVDSDNDGNIYAAADTGEEAPVPPYMITNESITVLRINPSGQITGRLELPFQPTGDEMQRPISIGDDGAVYMMQPSADGLAINRYTF
jgi:hypothetical protein